METLDLIYDLLQKIDKKLDTHLEDDKRHKKPLTVKQACKSLGLLLTYTISVLGAYSMFI